MNATMINKPVLVINSGSSSLKYQLVVPGTGDVLASGLVEQIGEASSHVKHKINNADGEDHSYSLDRPIVDHGEALAAVYSLCADHGPDLDHVGLSAVGHRVVHGGSQFSEPVIITPEVLGAIRELSALAPLHNPAAADGIAAAQERFSSVPHVAVFDSAFFTSLPPAAYTYAIPADLAAEHQIRRYGFHGTSHQYVSRAAAEHLGRPVTDLDQIVLHLGNGCSASAVQRGVAIDTSMGLTPLQGLVMGTRSGDVDPSLFTFLNRTLELSVAEIDTLLNKRSGLKGLSGVNDFRELESLVAQGDEAAQRAFEVYVHRLKHYVGAYLAQLGRLDSLVFTAGVGENSVNLRAAVCAGLSGLGISIDPVRNAERSSQARVISPDGSAVTVLVVPTNEELAIARQATDLLVSR